MLEEALTGLAQIVLKLGNLWFGMKLKEDAAISVDFDDSIIEDKDTSFERDLRMLEMGVITPAEMREKWREKQSSK